MKKNVAIIYDERSTYTKTVLEHVTAFKEFSRHNVFFLPGTNQHWPTSQGYTTNFSKRQRFQRKWSLDYFDVLILHYSVRSNISEYIADFITEAISKFRGRKILFIQDEYENVDEAIKTIDRLGFDVIYTCVPPDSIEYVYGKINNHDIQFIRNFTGYVPFLDSVERHALPIEERKILVGYRGRRLPHHYGLLGFDKFEIGERFKYLALSKGLHVDIETSDDKRIYKGWYNFLGSCRATLGTPSGANIFDFDGSLRKKAIALQNRSFEEVYREHFQEHEGRVLMDQISPKFFEAILLRTALVCYPGDYSGVLEENTHYITLNRDFSNFDEVVSKICDNAYLKDLTDRAYADIIESGLYSYQNFISSVDRVIDKLAPQRRMDIITTPIGVVNESGFNSFGKQESSDFLINNTVLYGELQRESFASEFDDKFDENDTVKWNCARSQDGACVSKSSKFHPAPHDAASLLAPYKPGNYAACLEGEPFPHFVEIDLGTKRNIIGFCVEWLSKENLGKEFTIQLSRNGFFWRDAVKVRNSNSEYFESSIDSQRARFVRIVVKVTTGQPRLLIRRFCVYASQVQER